MPEVRETPLFFQRGNKRLFGMLHEPAADAPHHPLHGVVSCAPFSEEAEISQKVRVDFARFLAQRGYWVFRFDYWGSGDSEGDFEDINLETQVSDICAAADYLRQRIDATVSLFGLRLGATLAALASNRIADLAGLALWEPVARPDRYIRSFIRTQAMAANTLAGRVVESRENLIQSLEAGKTIDVLAYPLSARCYQEFIGCDVEAAITHSQVPRLVAAIGSQKRKRKDLDLFTVSDGSSPQRIHFVQVEEKPFWTDPNDTWRELRFWRGHEELFARTASWLDSIATSGPAQ